MKMKNIRIPYKLHTFFASLLLVGLSHSAGAAVFDYFTQPLTIGPNSISITTDGVTATATAHHVEFDGGTSTIYGPFTTGNVGPLQVFGTNTSGIGNPGLGLTTSQDLGQTDFDIPGGGRQPAFDSSPARGSLPSIQFAVFSFDSPVDISQVIVDDVANLNRDIWVAGGSSAPDLSLDLVNAFNGFDIINSADNAGDGVFAHTFTTLQDLSYLAVGTALPSTVGDVGPFAQKHSGGGFTGLFITALNFQKSGVPPIPIPGAVWLFLSGLLGLWSWQRKTAQDKRA